MLNEGSAGGDTKRGLKRGRCMRVRRRHAGNGNWATHNLNEEKTALLYVGFNKMIDGMDGLVSSLILKAPGPLD